MKPVYSLDAPDQAKLKIARAEIEGVLQKHDLAGVVVLHTPGMTEFFYQIQPSYSCAWIDERATMLRVKSKLADYGGDQAMRTHDQVATANMLSSLADNLQQGARMFGDCAKIVDHTFGATHTPHGRVEDPGEGKPPQ